MLFKTTLVLYWEQVEKRDIFLNSKYQYHLHITDYNFQDNIR